MQQRKLGSQGLTTSAQGMGLMGMSCAYNTSQPVSEADCAKVIDRALQLGVNHLDTSDAYIGATVNEELLGNAIRDSKTKCVVATKFGFRVANGQLEVDNSPAYIREACDASLKRLGIPFINLYYLHRRDTRVSIEEAVGAMKELVQEGKVKHLGLSEVSASEIRRAHAIHPITAVQLEWSLWSREFEADVIPTCRELGIGIVAYAPLGRGFFTGTLSDPSQLGDGDYRATLPRFNADALHKNWAALQKIEALAKAKACTTGQLCLAWLHHQGTDVFPIPGTRRIKHLESNVAAFSIKLSREELKMLEDAVPAHEVVGDRYDELLGQWSFNKYQQKA